MFDPSFIEFIILLNKHEVEYLLIGGIAVNIYGYSRTTGDMDVWINPTNENGKRLVKAVDEFGFETSELAKKNFEETDVFFLGEPPFRIDILNKMQGLKFPGSFEKRNVIEHEKVKVNVLSLEDLKVNKLLSGRHKDLDDLENLSKIIN